MVAGSAKGCGRNAVEADGGIGLRHVDRSGDSQRAAHTKAHYRDLAAGLLQVLDRAAQILVGRAGKIEALHHVVGFVRFRGDPAFVKVWRDGVVAGARKAVGDAADLVVQPPPFLNHDHAGPAVAGNAPDNPWCCRRRGAKTRSNRPCSPFPVQSTTCHD